MKINERVVLITGAGKGLGKSLAIAFAKLGAKVAINDLTDIPLEKIAREIESFGGEVLCLAGDVSKKIQMQTLVSEMLEKWGRVDVLVNHARVRPQKPILDMDEWDWRRVLDVNLTSTFLTSQTIGRAMRSIGGGIIINVSDNAEDSQKLDAAYQTSQAGIAQFTVQLNNELNKEGIKAYNVSANPNGDEEIVEEVIGYCGFN
jgi:3-oxoacyl-[acyl-carrier protein] reductase